MILGFTAIVYMILYTFNIMKFEEEKAFYLWMGTMLELVIFDSILIILWRYN